MDPKQEETNKRLPRPLGITYLVKQNKTKEVQEQILTMWVTGNFTLCGNTYSIPDIARMLKINPSQVIRNVTKPLKSLLLDKGTQEDTYAAVLSLIFNFSLSDRTLIGSQLNLLLTSQGKGYKAFISQTVVNTLGQLNTSTNNLINLAKLFKPEVAKINPALTDPMSNPQGATNGTKYLGTVEAVKLIEAKREQNLLDGGTLQQQVLNKEAPSGLPEVVATKQQGLDATGLEKKPKRRIHDTSTDPDIKDAIIIP